MAGADIIETNTFSSTSIAQADYGMEAVVYELNRDGARLARRAALKAERADGRRRFVAGPSGRRTARRRSRPTSTIQAIRAVTFDDLRVAYGEQIRGLIDGGADLILIETIFDTLNAKAAIFACEEIFDERALRLPVMISGTITDRSGRTLSGQTPTAFWHSGGMPGPAPSASTALSAQSPCASIWRRSRRSPTRSSAPTPTPAFPTPSASTTRARRRWPAQIAGFARDGLVNIVGGCCGSTPEHIRAIAGRSRDVSRVRSRRSRRLCASPASSRSR